MGVKGLWRLLMPIGRRISIETLEGKILAVDASIWLTQFLKAMRDPDSGQVRPAAHLIGFFRRLCKLRYQGIRPVFVFDGATPEIKQRELRDRRRRREQFSNEHSEEVVQRLAKRLLVQQLRTKGSKISGAILKKKNKEGQTTTEEHYVQGDTTTTTGAYAPGFYDPEMDHAPATSISNDTAKPSNAWGGASDQEICEILEDSTDYLGQATSTISHESDWDTLVVDTHTLQESADKGSEQEEREGKSTAPIPNYTSGDPNEFNPTYVASLPPTQRKDMVENAQRQRRLQSRREFMKVAYDPEGLSKCQLRNFLKSTRLNQNIHKMAQQASKASGLDNALASDKTKRIIFETNSDVGDVSREKMRKELEIRKLGQKRKISVMSSSDDESDNEVNWKDTAGLDAGTKTVKPWKTRAILDEDESSESEGEESSANMIEYSDRANHVGGSSSDEASAGGFITKPSTSQNSNSYILGSSGDRLEIPVHGNDSSDGEDRKKPAVEFTNKGGMVLMHPRSHPARTSSSLDSSRETRARLVIHESDSSDSEKKQGHTSNMHDHTLQEMNDEVIARALQEAEYDTDVDVRVVDQAEDSLVAKISDSNILRNLENQEDASENPEDASDDNDEIDWEDGEGQQDDNTGDQEPTTVWCSHSASNPVSIPASAKNGPHKHVVAETYVLDGNNSENDNSSTSQKVSHTPISQTDHGIIQALPSTGNKASKPVGPLMHESTDCPSKSDKEIEEDFIEWKDGNEEEEKHNSKTPETAQAKSPSLCTATEMCSDSLSLPDGGGDIEEIDYQDSDFNVDNRDLTFHEAWPEVVQKDHEAKSSEISAALEHAQATAARLTNWAGRAFRRAVAQHAAENGLTIPDKDDAEMIHGGGNDHSTSDQNSNDVSESHMQSIDEKANDQKADLCKSSGDVQQTTTRTPQSSTVAWPEILGDDAVLHTLEEYEEQWAHERNQQDRDSDTVTDEMRTEAMNLLQLFGVPYVEAPAEAEAQCVMLEKLGLVDGIVTEDSDAFVFGGKRIYKNIFDDQRYVEVYDAQDAEKEMNLTRDGLVALAMLLGGDYTEGVKGVGIVNGMEIVQAFDVSRDVKEGLDKFRHWLDGFNPFDSLNVAQGKEQMTKEQIFHRKHHTARTRWVAPKYFPDPKVLSAYLNPVVDNSNEKFSWGIPDMDRLILFCNKHVGWSADETRQLLKPVVEKIESGKSMYQTRIDSFMKYEDGIKFANVLSKRLRDVLNDVKGDVGKTDDSQPTKKRKAAGKGHT